MLGWMILFGLLALCFSIASVSGHQPAASVKLASQLFSGLFLISMLTRAARDRTR